MSEPGDAAGFDPTGVARLRDDVGPVAAAGMIDRFLAMLPGRLDRLRLAVAAGEARELRDAALSLGCSASMLGAHRLAAVSERCRTATGDGAREVLTELLAVAAATATTLRTSLAQVGAARLSAGR